MLESEARVRLGSMIAAGSEESWNGNRGYRSDAGVRGWPAMSVPPLLLQYLPSPL